MQDFFEFEGILGSLCTLTPFILVWLAALVLALVNWRKCPQPALFMFLAAALELFSTFAGEAFNWFILGGAGFDGFGVVRIVWIFRSVVGAAAWGLMIAAVLGWRNQKGPRETREEDYYPPPRRSAPSANPPRAVLGDDAETIREKP